MNEEKRIDGLTRDQVVQQYEPMVHKFVNKTAHTNYVCNKEDLVQEGKMAIIVAFDTFDEGKAKFTTWVYHNVKNAILTYQKNNLGALSGGTYLINKINQIKQSEIPGEETHQPDLIEALRDRKVAHETAVAAQYISNQYTCVDLSDVAATLADPQATIDAKEKFGLDWQSVLDEDEIQILNLYFGFDGEAKSVKEIAAIMGRSARSIHYRYEKALNKIRAMDGIENFAFDL